MMTKPSIVVLFALFLLPSLCSSLTPVKPLSEWTAGIANHFGAPKDHPIDPLNPVVRMGGCSYGELDPTQYPFYNIVAIHPDSQLLNGLETNGCGACFEVQCIDQKADHCVNGPFANNVVVVNSGGCANGCGGTTINLHTFAFDKIAAIKFGMVQTRVRQVECEPFGYVEVRVKNFRVEEGGYLKVAVRNVPGTGGLAKLELKGKANRFADGGWLTFKNQFGAAWELSGLPDPPFDLRLTVTIDGEERQKILSDIIQEAGFTGNVDSNSQFPGVDPFPKTAGLSSRPPSPQPAASVAPVTPRTPPAPPPTGSPNATSSDKPNVDPGELDSFLELLTSDEDR
ncbi:hypothetical protein BSKO_13168 [Bryopsis sp. KO-2023]|nr:hypothetical protein BSKO_13168 [Bryopsis sp. KO-2023]